MKRYLVGLLLASASLAAQTGTMVFANPGSSTTVSLTITVAGGGSGSIVDSLGQISCTDTGGVQSGTCATNYAIGQPVTLTATPSGGAQFNWSSGTGSASVCSGTAACAFSITANSTVTGLFTGAGSGAIQASPTFSIDNNSNVVPTDISHGQERFWDTPNATWPFVQTSVCAVSPCLGGANNVFNFGVIDSLLAAMEATSVHSAQAALGRIPSFASGGAGDPVTGDYSCGYSVAPNGTGHNAPGQCDAPTDLNLDGTGANQFWRDWVGAYLAHVNGLDDPNCPGGPTCYTKTHAHVVDLEMANETDVAKFWRSSTSGSFLQTSFDQLIRMQEDLYAIAKGDANFTFTLTSVNTTGVYQGTITKGGSNYYKGQHFNITGFVNGSNNLTNAICTASTTTSITFAAVTINESHAGTIRMVNTYTGETAAQVRATVRSIALSGPVDTTALVMMPSYHAPSTVVQWAQAFLYCTGNQCSGGSGCTGASSHPKCMGPGGHVTTDAINEHTKPASGYGVTANGWMASTLSTWEANITGILQPAELSLPLYGTEGGFNSSGWCTSGTGSTCHGPYTIDQNQAAAIIQFYVLSWVGGFTNIVWYDYSKSAGGLGSAAANTAYNTAYNGMVGATSMSCSANQNGTGNLSQPSLYKCPFTEADGTSAMWVWDADNTGGTPGTSTSDGTFWDSTPPATQNLECHSGFCPTHSQSITTGWQQKSWIDVGGVQHNQAPCTTCSYSIGIQPILVQGK